MKKTEKASQAVRCPIMLDSGAYSAWRAGKEVDFKEYMRYLHYLIDKYPDADFEYVNLDVIGDGEKSYKNWMTMRDNGLNPMPVWHLTSSHSWLVKYLKLTDRVALSWFGQMPYRRRILSLDYLWTKYLTNDKNMATARVHGMGVADFRILQRYPWDTVDSTSWLLTAAMGDVFVPKRKKGEWSYDVRPNRVTMSGKVLRWSHGRVLGHRLSQHEQKAVEEYMKVAGGEVLEGDDGVKNSWRPRRRLNSRYYWEFVRRLKVPRPFGGMAVEAPGILWEADEIGKGRTEQAPSNSFGHTLLYLAGNIDWTGPDEFLDFHRKFPGLGRLTSFWYVQSPKSKASNLENLLDTLEEGTLNAAPDVLLDILDQKKGSV